MKTSVDVKIQTGFFERTDFMLNIAAGSLVLKPIAKSGESISIPTSHIKSITFYEMKLKMEIQADVLTDAYFKSEGDWLDAMKALREETGVIIICEVN